MDPLRLVRLPALMALGEGSPKLAIGLVDGPVAVDHPDLAAAAVRPLDVRRGARADAGSAACRHATSVAGILAARRGADAPAIAPGCPLLVRPIFLEPGPGGAPRATPAELAAGIAECVDAGARIVNISAAVDGAGADAGLCAVLDYCLGRGVLVVAAAGNQGRLAGSVVTRHRWVLPVVGYSAAGRVLAESNLGASIGRRGLGAPGAGVRSLTPGGPSAVLAGTSVAAPFVAGAAALLWSAFPGASAAEIKHAMLASPGGRRTVAPPLLDAEAAYQQLWNRQRRQPSDRKRSHVADPNRAPAGPPARVPGRG